MIPPVRFVLNSRIQSTVIIFCTAENNKNGHSVEMILMAADIFGISDITALKAGAVQGLLDEMVDMGILVRPTLNTYRLRQRRFLDAIGPSDEQIFQRIEEMKHNE